MTEAKPSLRRLSQSTIVVISSDQSHCQALRVFLDALAIGNQIFMAPEEAAVAQVISHKPNLILLDGSGDEDRAFRILEQLCQAPILRETPVLVAISESHSGNPDLAFSLGATDVVSLPFRGSEIINRLRAYLERNLYKEESRRFQEGFEEGAALARQLQESLLPTPLGIRDIEQAYGLQLDFYFEASQSVGGDLWGFHRLSQNKLGVFSIDFSGHGVSAALNCFRFNTTMSETTPNLDDPASYLSILNKALKPAIRRGQFATMFYGILDVKERCLIYAAAGSPGPIVGLPHRRDSYRPLDTSGVPLGITDDAVYKNIKVDLDPGAFVFLYSDALIEATQIMDGKPLSDEGVMGLLAESISDFETVPPLDGMIGRFFERIAWSELPDDLTAVWLHLPETMTAKEPIPTIAGVPR